MLKISVDKGIFNNIYSKNTDKLQKKASKFYKAKLINPILVHNKIFYGIKNYKNIEICNGLAKDAPSMLIEVKKTTYDKKIDIFTFYLGDINEKRNIIYKTSQEELIEELQKEKNKLEERIYIDDLSGVYNLKKFQNDMQELEKNMDFEDFSFSFISINNFNSLSFFMAKNILKNIGDKLKKYSQILQASIYRYSDNTFLVSAKQGKELLKQSLILAKTNIENINFSPKEDDIFYISIYTSFDFYSKDMNLNTFLQKTYSTHLMQSKEKQNGKNLDG